MARSGVSGPTLAKHLDLSRQRVPQLVDEGVIKANDDGSFDLDACRLAYIRWLRGEDRRATKSAADSRLRDMKAEEVQLRMDEKRGVLLAAGQAEAVKVIDEFFGGLKADLLAIPARVTTDIATRRKIEDGLNQAFGAAAKRAIDAADRVETAGATIRSATAPASRRVGKATGLPVKRRRSRAA